jgi:hypothetical protein
MTYTGAVPGQCNQEDTMANEHKGQGDAQKPGYGQAENNQQRGQREGAGAQRQQGQQPQQGGQNQQGQPGGQRGNFADDPQRASEAGRKGGQS